MSEHRHVERVGAELFLPLTYTELLALGATEPGAAVVVSVEYATTARIVLSRLTDRDQWLDGIRDADSDDFDDLRGGSGYA